MKILYSTDTKGKKKERWGGNLKSQHWNTEGKKASKAILSLHFLCPGQDMHTKDILWSFGLSTSSG